MIAGKAAVVTAGLTGSPTILAVDDEELMREVVGIMIEENGGKVFTACDGVEALEVYKQNQASIDAVFLDFSMPRMNGYDTVVELRKIDPTLPILMVSGLKVSAATDELVKRGDIDFMNKPFQETELVSRLNLLISKRKK